MIHYKNLLLTLLLVFSISTKIKADEELAKIPSQELSGTWSTMYADHRLGMVEGVAQIKAYGDILLISGYYLHPRTQERYPFEGDVRANDIYPKEQETDENGSVKYVEIVIKVSGPVTMDHLPEDHAAIIELATGESLTAQIGTKKSSVKMNISPKRTEFITLNFYLEDNTLSGTWSCNGVRIGSKKKENGISKNIGIEIWQRQQPIFYGEAIAEYPATSFDIKLQGQFLPAVASQIQQIEFAVAGLTFDRFIPSSDTSATLRVNLDQYVTPGLKILTLNGAEGEWFLEYKGVPRQARFTRMIREDQYETLDTLYIGEVFHVELQIAKNLEKSFRGVDSYELLLLAPTVQDSENKTQEQFSETTITLKKVPGENFFRSSPIVCISPEEESQSTANLQVVCPAGKQIFASSPVLLVDFTQATATVVATPPDLWDKALQTAHHCKLAFPNRQEVEGIHVDEKIHAGMLLIRNELRQQLEKEASILNTFQGLKELRKLRDTLTIMANKSQDDPLLIMQISTPDGGNTTLRRALSRSDRFGMDETAFEEYTIRITSEAQGKILNAMDRSLAKIRSTSDCDIEGLVDLVGIGYDAVIHSLQPRLMRENPQGDPSLIPNLTARATLLEGVKGVAVAVEAQLEYSQQRRDMLLLLATAPVAGLAYGSGVLGYAAIESAAVFTLSGFEALDVAMGAWSFKQALVDDEMATKFALGVSPIVGLDLYERAKAKQKQHLLEGAFQAFAQTAPSAFAKGSKWVLKDLPPSANKNLLTKIFHKGTDLLNSAENKLWNRLSDRISDKVSRTGFDKLTPFEMAGFQALSSEALENLAKGKPLSGKHRSALKAYEEAFVDSVRSPPSKKLSQALPPDLRDKIPVHVSPDLPGNTVRVQYSLDANDTVSKIHLQVGPKASLEDIHLHENTIRQIQKYSGLSGTLRNQFRQLRQWRKKHGPPTVGSRAWEAGLEVKKLTKIIDNKMKRLSHRNLNLHDQGAIIRNINNLKKQLDENQSLLDELDTNPGRGFVAAEAEKDELENLLKKYIDTNQNEDDFLSLYTKVDDASLQEHKGLKPLLKQVQKSKDAAKTLREINALDDNNLTKVLNLHGEMDNFVRKKNKLDNKIRNLETDIKELQKQSNKASSTEKDTYDNKIDPKVEELKKKKENRNKNQTNIRKTKEEIKNLLAPANPRTDLCFAGSTMIWTPSGLVRIDNLKQDDMVLAFSFEDNSVVSRRILAITQSHTHYFYELKIEEVTLEVTGSHLFWSQGRWVMAKDLQMGSMLNLLGINEVKLQAIQRQKTSLELCKTYNLDIETNSNYFVGPGVLVHNGGEDWPVKLGNKPYSIYRGLVGEENSLVDHLRSTNLITSDFKLTDSSYIGQTNAGVETRKYEHIEEGILGLLENGKTNGIHYTRNESNGINKVWWEGGLRPISYFRSLKSNRNKFNKFIQFLVNNLSETPLKGKTKEQVIKRNLFKIEMEIKEVVNGLSREQANFLEQKNMDVEKRERGGVEYLINEREQRKPNKMAELEKKLCH